MIAPKKIKVWGSLGMQTQLIPDSSFSSLTGGFHYLVYSRLNGEGRNIYFLTQKTVSSVSTIQKTLTVNLFSEFQGLTLWLPDSILKV